MRCPAEVKSLVLHKDRNRELDSGAFYFSGIPYPLCPRSTTQHRHQSRIPFLDQTPISTLLRWTFNLWLLGNSSLSVVDVTLRHYSNCPAGISLHCLDRTILSLQKSSLVLQISPGLGYIPSKIKGLSGRRPGNTWVNDHAPYSAVRRRHRKKADDNDTR